MKFGVFSLGKIFGRLRRKEIYDDDDYDEARINIAKKCMKLEKIVIGKIYKDGIFEIDEKKEIKNEQTKQV